MQAICGTKSNFWVMWCAWESIRTRAWRITWRRSIASCAHLLPTPSGSQAARLDSPRLDSQRPRQICTWVETTFFFLRQNHNTHVFIPFITLGRKGRCCGRRASRRGLLNTWCPGGSHELQARTPCVCAKACRIPACDATAMRPWCDSRGVRGEGWHAYKSGWSRRYLSFPASKMCARSWVITSSLDHLSRTKAKRRASKTCRGWVSRRQKINHSRQTKSVRSWARARSL